MSAHLKKCCGSVFRLKHGNMWKPPNIISFTYSNEPPDSEAREESFSGPVLPQYTERLNEPENEKRARLIYQSRKRGMLENCLLLSTFAAKYLDSFTPEQLQKYDVLINKPDNDWDIYKWATGKVEAPDEFKSDILDLLKRHTLNEDRESRITMPDLYKKDSVR